MWQKVQDWAAYLLTLVNIVVWSWVSQGLSALLKASTP